MTARNKLLGFLSKNADMLTPQQAARVEAMSKVSGPVGALGVVGGWGQVSSAESETLAFLERRAAHHDREAARIRGIAEDLRRELGLPTERQPAPQQVILPTPLCISPIQ